MQSARKWFDFIFVFVFLCSESMSGKWRLAKCCCVVWRKQVNGASFDLKTVGNGARTDVQTDGRHRGEYKRVWQSVARIWFAVVLTRESSRAVPAGDMSHRRCIRLRLPPQLVHHPTLGLAWATAPAVTLPARCHDNYSTYPGNNTVRLTVQ